jgi:hypothetical protein
LPQILPSFSLDHYITSITTPPLFSPPPSTPFQYREEHSLLASSLIHSLTNHTIASCMLSTAISVQGSSSNPQFHSS